MSDVMAVLSADGAAHSATLSPGARGRSIAFGLLGFFTLVDLFAAQAILPALARRYEVAPGQIGVAVNSGVIGMAIAGLVAGAAARRVERRIGIWLSLALLAIPTLLLAWAPDLATFAGLRVTQGLFMATAFTLTLTYLGERCNPEDAASAMAAFVTGIVASNLVGRLVAANVASWFGVDAAFYLFTFLNLLGALLAYRYICRTVPMAAMDEARPPIVRIWLANLSDSRLLRAFGIGFLNLFGFIGLFTYVNFVLAAEPFRLAPAALGLVYLVFTPAMVTTPMAGAVSARYGNGRVIAAGLGLSAAALWLVVQDSLPMVLLGLGLVGVGAFFAQAASTSYVSKTAQLDRAAASGQYLCAYYCGGLMGAAIVGKIFDASGWLAAVACVAGAFGLGAVLGASLPRARARA